MIDLKTYTLEALRELLGGQGPAAALAALELANRAERALADNAALRERLARYELADLHGRVAAVEREYAEYDAAREKDGKWTHEDSNRRLLLSYARVLRAQLEIYEVQDLPEKLAAIEARQAKEAPLVPDREVKYKQAVADRGVLLVTVRELRAEVKQLVEYIRLLAPCGLCEGTGVLKEEMRLCVRCGGGGWVREARPFAEAAEIAFSAGVRHAAGSNPEVCPYPEDSPKALWWSRGYGYMERALSAAAAQRDLNSARGKLARLRAPILFEEGSDLRDLGSDQEHVRDLLVRISAWEDLDYPDKDACAQCGGDNAQMNFPPRPVCHKCGREVAALLINTIDVLQSRLRSMAAYVEGLRKKNTDARRALEAAQVDRHNAHEGIMRYRRVHTPQLRFVGQTEVGARIDVDDWEKDHAKTFPQDRPCPT